MPKNREASSGITISLPEMQVEDVSRTTFSMSSSFMEDHTRWTLARGLIIFAPRANALILAMEPKIG